MGEVSQPINAGAIDYDALEIALVKRFASDYSFRVWYTLGNSRGNTTGAAIPFSGFQVLDDLNLDQNEGPTNVDRRHNLVISGQALVPKTGGLTVAWVARALSGSHFTLIDSTTDPDRNGTFAEPLPSGSYESAGRNPWNVDFESKRNGATGPGLFQLDLRLGYRLRLDDGAQPRPVRRCVQRHQPRQLREPDRRSPLDGLPEPDGVARGRRSDHRPDRRAVSVLTRREGRARFQPCLPSAAPRRAFAQFVLE